MRILRSFALTVCSILFFCLGVHAEGLQPRAIGVMSEANFGYMTCTGNKPYGSPSYFVVRTNRPDIFLENFPATRTCVGLAKKYLENQKRYRDKTVPLYPGVTTAVHTGGLGLLHCKKWQSIGGGHLMYEFKIPWLDDAEIDTIVNETLFVMCILGIDKVESVVPQRYDYTSES